MSRNIVVPDFNVAAGGTTDFVRNAAAERVRQAFNDATGIAAATVKLGGKYGMRGLVVKIKSWAVRAIFGMVNALAKADAALIELEQDLAAYTAYRVPTAWPSVAQSVGGFYTGRIL